VVSLILFSHLFPSPQLPLQIEPTIAQAIQENLGVQCRSDETVREILRAIRTHFTKFVKVLGDGRLEQSQLGLGHSYSRSKVKFNPGRADNMIIQSIALLDQLDKDLNTFAMRVREWYGWHFPELKNIVRDNYLYARCAAFIQVLPSLTPLAHLNLLRTSPLSQRISWLVSKRSSVRKLMPMLFSKQQSLQWEWIPPHRT
jgi:hypothetical protein